MQYLTGSDDKTLWGTADDVTFSGGFGELSFMPVTRFVGFLRYDLVNSPKEINRDRDRMTLGGRYYLVDNVSLHSEFSRLTLHKAGTTSDDEVDDFLTMRIDFAF
jgi:hypothetical protein